MSPSATVAWLRQRWWVALLLLLALFLAGASRLVVGAVGDARERRATRDYLIECTTPGDDPPPHTGHACYDRQLEATGRAVNDLRRSVDCAVLYIAGKRPPACAEVSARMDAIVAGGDPFSRGAP